MARISRKANLPTRICEVCRRPFSWRRKWARDWENVKYCSRRCRGVTPLSARELQSGKA